MFQETTSLLAIIKSNFFTFFSIICGLLAPIQPILLLVFAFIVIDTVMGVWASKKLKREITSKKFSTFISKMLVYGLVVILTYALDKLLLGEFLFIFVSINLLATKVAAIALIVAEVYSIDEKLVNVKGKGIWHYFKRLIGVAKLIKKEANDLELKK